MDVKELETLLGKYQPDQSKFRPFRLRFKMMTPVCLSHPWIHLDGIIAHLLLRKLLGRDFYLLPSKLPIDFFKTLTLPLKRYKQDKAFMYHSSVSFFEIKQIYVDTLFKRFEDKFLRLMDEGRSTRIDTTRGRFKNYMIRLPYISTPTVTFYGHGNISEIKNLIKRLPGLGKKIAAGFGFFNSFSIKQTRQDCSIIKNGLAARPIPLLFVDETQEHERMLLAYKFPYWAKGNVLPCVPPEEKIYLKNKKSCK